ncbi:MAG: hypothetical protein JW801_09885 [Bacteroidales bacterium]|nr:hypothetical protein [Bacteroidales bacterium]
MILPAVYGQAFQFLKYAQAGYEELEGYTRFQIMAYRMARNFLRIPEE